MGRDHGSTVEVELTDLLRAVPAVRARQLATPHLAGQSAVAAAGH